MTPPGRRRSGTEPREPIGGTDIFRTRGTPTGVPPETGECADAVALSAWSGEAAVGCGRHHTDAAGLPWGVRSVWVAETSTHT